MKELWGQCENCDEPFEKKAFNQKFCSRGCRKAFHSRKNYLKHQERLQNDPEYKESFLAKKRRYFRDRYRMDAVFREKWKIIKNG